MLEGKIVFISGSTRGIGWAIARAFASQKATVIINGRSNGALVDERVAELRSTYGIQAEGSLFDVADPVQVREFYSNLYKKHKALHVLVNNAGILVSSVLGMTTPEIVDRVFRVNVYSVLYNMQYAARLMEKGGGGSIINMSSIFGSMGSEGHIAYSGSKAAIIGMTRSAAKELAPKNIRVNAIAPGFITTDMTGSLSEEQRNERIGSIKMNRAGTPEDVASVALFLASNLSGYVTGQVVGVDGEMII